MRSTSTGHSSTTVISFHMVERAIERPMYGLSNARSTMWKDITVVELCPVEVDHFRIIKFALNSLDEQVFYAWILKKMSRKTKKKIFPKFFVKWSHIDSETLWYVQGGFVVTPRSFLIPLVAFLRNGCFGNHMTTTAQNTAFYTSRVKLLAPQNSCLQSHHKI